MRYYGVNGDAVTTDRWNDITFPDHPPRVNETEGL
jgi:hypothetical protein